MASLDVRKLDEKLEYMMKMRPVLNKSALFSDGTVDYREPAEPEPGDTVTIRFRAGKNNLDMVWLCMDEQRLPMEKYETVEKFDYYRVQLTLEQAAVQYYLRWSQDFRSAVMTAEVSRGNRARSIISPLCRDSPRRTGQKVR